MLHPRQVMTREVLRPLDREIQAARAIESGKLDERLRPTKRDEIGEVGIAFDTMLDRLAGMVASQRRFVADAAHELRTPLTALGGMVEMLQMGADRGDPSTVRRMLNTMSGEIDRLGRLVADLLTLSRMDAEKPLRPVPVALGPLVEEIAAQTRLLANGQEIVVRIDRPATVMADPDRLKQVLLNLTANALRFTPAGGEIALRLSTSDQRAILQVSDTGSGIAPELLPRVMDRFVRGDASRARHGGIRPGARHRQRDRRGARRHHRDRERPRPRHDGDDRPAAAVLRAPVGRPSPVRYVPRARDGIDRRRRAVKVRRRRRG